MKDQSKYIELDVVDSGFWWQNYIRGVAFDGKEFVIEDEITITDTGTSCTYMPMQYYETFMSHVTRDIETLSNPFDSENPLTYLQCRDIGKLPKIEFNFGYYWLEMLPDDYAIIQDYNCFICILPQDYDMWILGNSFLRGFYSTYDMRRNKFGFAVHASSSKSHPRYGVPSPHMTKLIKHKESRQKDSTTGSRKTIIILVCSLVVVIVAGVILWFVFKPGQDKVAAPLVVLL